MNGTATHQWTLLFTTQVNEAKSKINCPKKPFYPPLWRPVKTSPRNGDKLCRSWWQIYRWANYHADQYSTCAEIICPRTRIKIHTYKELQQMQTCQGWEKCARTAGSRPEGSRAGNGALGEGAGNPSPPARGSGERCKLPHRNRIWCILALKSDIWWQQF